MTDKRCGTCQWWHVYQQPDGTGDFGLCTHPELMRRIDCERFKWQWCEHWEAR